MQLIFDIRHPSTTIHEILNNMDIVLFAGLETIAVMENESIVAFRYNFGIYSGFSGFQMRHALSVIQNNSELQW